MKRREFITLSAVGSAAGIIAPKEVLGGIAACPNSNKMAGGVYYTKDAPGRWSKKVKGHLPNIETSKNAGDTLVNVVTNHEMAGYAHYINKHIVLDDNFKFITEKLFDPLQHKQPVSEHNLGNYSGRIHVLSVCNTHDTWLNLADV
ncbi:MAG TPA: hypothetical protein ENJ32_08125 [Crenotrichaceae bacterium]|nr:hypothetical protein [Crenotrichaceae bacterium]